MQGERLRQAAAHGFARRAGHEQALAAATPAQQPGALELAQRLPHRRAVHLELAGELGFGRQGLPLLQLPAQDPGPDGLGDPQVGRGIAEGFEHGLASVRLGLACLIVGQYDARMQARTAGWRAAMFPIDFDFELGARVDELRQAVREFALRRIAPQADEIDRSNRFPRELWPEMGAMGLLGMTVPEEYGGLGFGYLEHVVAMEEISRVSGSIGLSYGAHSNLCVNQLRRFGTDEQKRRYLPRLVTGEDVGALAMSEPGSGSDVVSMRTRAERRAGGYVLNGSKMWITNGPEADTAVIYATIEPGSGAKGITAFIVERGMKGLSLRAETRQVRHARLGHLRTRVRRLLRAGRQPAGPCRWRRGDPDVGTRLRAAGADGRSARAHARGARPHRALPARPRAVRPADRQLPADAGEARGPLRRLQRLARLRLRGRARLRCRPHDALRRRRLPAAASENATRAGLEAIQVLGGNGYINEYPAGRILRDAKLYEIGAGTNEIRRMLIGRELLRATAP